MNKSIINITSVVIAMTFNLNASWASDSPGATRFKPSQGMELVSMRNFFHKLRNPRRCAIELETAWHYYHRAEDIAGLINGMRELDESREQAFKNELNRAFSQNGLTEEQIGIFNNALETTKNESWQGLAPQNDSSLLAVRETLSNLSDGLISNELRYGRFYGTRLDDRNTLSFNLLTSGLVGNTENNSLTKVVIKLKIDSGKIRVHDLKTPYSDSIEDYVVALEDSFPATGFKSAQTIRRIQSPNSPEHRLFYPGLVEVDIRSVLEDLEILERIGVRGPRGLDARHQFMDELSSFFSNAKNLNFDEFYQQYSQFKKELNQENSCFETYSNNKAEVVDEDLEDKNGDVYYYKHYHANQWQKVIDEGYGTIRTRPTGEMFDMQSLIDRSEPQSVR